MIGQALVFPEANRAEVQAYDVPELRLDEMRVRTEYSGVSQGTEMWAYAGKRPELKFPTVPGYQSVGVIEEIGPEVRGFTPGQRVLFLSSRLPDSLPPTWMGAHVSHALVLLLQGWYAARSHLTSMRPTPKSRRLPLPAAWTTESFPNAWFSWRTESCTGAK